MSKNTSISVRGAVALGVGSMVGAGIYALMGEAAKMAGSAVWAAFLGAGIVALLTGYSFVQLGVRYPSRGGVVEYLVKAYGVGWFSGGSSILFYIAQLIGMSMIALAFGTYASKLFGVGEGSMLCDRLFASGVILALAALNLFGSKLVSKAQGLVVVGNLVLLTLFALALTKYAEPARLAVGLWPTGTPVISSLALTFFAFTGFAVVSNAAEDMKDPARDLPRAMYTTIVIVIVLYVALALAITAAVSEKALTSSGAMLLAEAARAGFGEVGYTVLLISAVISTATCINGGLYGMTNITYTLAEKGQLPSRFSKEVRASTRGLTISSALGLMMVNFMTLSTVASLGSATSLMVYSLVNFGAYRLIKDGGKSRILILLSVIACVVAIAVWVMYTLRTSPGSLWIFFLFLVGAFVAEGLLQRFQGRRILAEGNRDESPLETGDQA
jgi:amino acid transporter